VTKAQYQARLLVVDAYFKINFDGTKVPFNTTKAYKTFSAQCTALINTKHSSVSFEDYSSKKDAYQAFNAILPSYDKLAATTTESEDIWA